MTKSRDPNALLSAYLAGGMEVLPDRVVDSVLDEVHRTRQRTVLGPWRIRITSQAALGTVALVAVLVVGGAFLITRDQDGIGTPTASPEVSASPSQPAVVTATPTPTPTAEVLSLDLTWTEVDIDDSVQQVAWLGDRFVMVDDTGAVSTSTDGATWRALQPGEPDPGYADLLKGRIVTWEDDVIGWWNPEDGPDYTNKPPVTARDILTIVQPPADPFESTPFDGRIESIGIGPLGIVAHVHSRLNYATEVNWDSWVTEKLGLRTNNDWTCCVKDVTFQGGVLDITLTNGPGLHVVWADEGFLPGDYQDRGFGWYSPDGVEWTAIPSDIPPTLDRGDLPAFPTGMGEVVGVSDGFIARGVTPEETCTLPDGCSEMWHSADGLTWRNLGHPSAEQDFFSGRLLPWQGGALLTDGIGRFDFWTSDGYQALPMAAELPAHPQEDEVVLGTGPFGFVSLRLDRMEILVTRDGVDWELQPTPSAMDTDTDRRVRTIAVGERSVLYLTWSGYFGEGPLVPHLWVGTVEP
ncbi:MAG TPA: hypothetical protein VFX65_13330 [Candidatus Limnocylindrales bacterium]|nr:hypothetical protein [Candidatus Limnocylindrales bacterium]